MNTTKFKIVGIRNGIASLEKVGGGFSAYADSEWLGDVGSVVELEDKDYIPEGDLSAYSAMGFKYDEEAE